METYIKNAILSSLRQFNRHFSPNVLCFLSKLSKNSSQMQVAFQQDISQGGNSIYIVKK